MSQLWFYLFGVVSVIYDFWCNLLTKMKIKNADNGWQQFKKV